MNDYTYTNIKNTYADDIKGYFDIRKCKTREDFWVICSLIEGYVTFKPTGMTVKKENMHKFDLIIDRMLEERFIEEL